MNFDLTSKMTLRALLLSPFLFLLQIIHKQHILQLASFHNLHYGLLNLVSFTTCLNCLAYAE